VASYTPHFENEQVRMITEERVPKNGLLARGEYHYQGARLLRYQGTAFESNEPLAAEFTLQGTLVAARKANSEASQSEITHLRTRAQLLRSHALAQRATELHSGK
jgi:hypothetical protein